LEEASSATGVFLGRSDVESAVARVAVELEARFVDGSGHRVGVVVVVIVSAGGRGGGLVTRKSSRRSERDLVPKGRDVPVIAEDLSRVRRGRDGREEIV
jgi:hypothetical protein